MHVAKNKVSVAQRARKPEALPDSGMWNLAEEIQKVRKDLKGELHYAIPASSALLQVVELPTQDDEEIAGMVELQAEELSPFPMDRTYKSWEVLSRTETHSRVLIALAGHSIIDPLEEAFRSSKLLLHRVDVDVLCWWRLLAQQQEVPDTGFHLILVADQEQLHLIGLDRGLPIGFHSLGNPEELGAGDVIEELSFALTEWEAERGLSDPVGLKVWHWGALPGFVNGLDGVAASVNYANLASIPSLSDGVVLRAVELNGSGIDLSPLRWKEAEAARQTKKRLLSLSGGMAALWLVGMLSLVVFVGVKRNENRDLRMRIAKQEDQVLAVQNLEAQVRSLSQFTDRTYSALETLREIAVHMPTDGILLDTVTYQKRRGLSVRGRFSNRQQDFLEFNGRMERSALYRLEPFDLEGDKFSVKAKWAWQITDAEGDES